MRARGVLVGLVGFALVGCAQVQPGGPSPSPGSPGGSTPPPTTPGHTAAPTTPAGTPTASGPGNTCDALARAMDLRTAAGQLVMIGVTGALDDAEAKAIKNSHIGSAILMGSTSDGVSGTKARTDAIRKAGGAHGVLIGVDQEGGSVVRLKGSGFTAMPSAAQQAKLSDAELTGKAATWGKELRAAGVDLNFAPVADVVPASKQSSNEPIGKLGRGYGSEPDQVAAKVGAVVDGFQRSGIGATVKHFPNLGQVTGNTDFAAKVVDDVTTADDPALAPYRTAIDADVASIMISTAYFSKIDGSAPAAFSPKVIAIARSLGFDGVITSDDLGVAKAVADVPAKQRAVRFVKAGGDLAISVDPAAATAMVTGLVEAGEADPAFADQVKASAARVMTLKGRLGVTTCSPARG
ncbi:glycoside hydrolase family 3 N-terminal domain-containing protein [Propioniciclava coleopterorum]|nr:glycoside hydrolase family 3 N-terminal domain-containing protein [Propioniciclava coleopterorum]